MGVLWGCLSNTFHKRIKDRLKTGPSLRRLFEKQNQKHQSHHRPESFKSYQVHLKMVIFK